MRLNRIVGFRAKRNHFFGEAHGKVPRADFHHHGVFDEIVCRLFRFYVFRRSLVGGINLSTGEDRPYKSRRRIEEEVVLNF